MLETVHGAARRLEKNLELCLWMQLLLLTLNWNLPCGGDRVHEVIHVRLHTVHGKEEKSWNLKWTFWGVKAAGRFPHSVWTRWGRNEKWWQWSLHQIPDGDTTSLSVPGSLQCSNYQAEVLAICTAAEHLLESGKNMGNIAIFTGSQSTLQALN